jgi:hypothetical protein
MIRNPDPDLDFLPIPDPGIKKAPDPDPQHCQIYHIIMIWRSHKLIDMWK